MINKSSYTHWKYIILLKVKWVANVPRCNKPHQAMNKNMALLNQAKRPIFKHPIPVCIICVDSELFPCVSLEQC